MRFINRPAKHRMALMGTILVLLGVLIRWSWISRDISDPVCKLKTNAAWVSVDWTSRPIDVVRIGQLASDVRNRDIKYLFPYVSYLKRDGTFSKSYDHAGEFVAAYKQVSPQTKLLAWIGLPITNTAHSEMAGWVDLSDAATRRKITTFVADLVHQANFDGVHLNAEPIPGGDTDFLKLLEEIRQMIGAGKMISVAGHHWAPDALTQFPKADWTSSYYRTVAEHVDQVVVMAYDSQLTSPALYRLWMREQVKHIAESVAATDAGLLIGISVSQEQTESHHPSAETLVDGLAGLCAGVPSELGLVKGVAVYADWEFSNADWQVWREWQH